MNRLRGEDEFAVLRHAQAVFAAVVRDHELAARAKKHIARHLRGRGLRRLGRLLRLMHNRTIMVLIANVNSSQVALSRSNNVFAVSEYSLIADRRRFS